jgi:WD40 repeat protein
LVAAAVQEGQANREKYTIQLWDAASGARVRAFQGEHSERIAALRWSPDGKQLVSCSWDQTAKVWDVATGRCTHTLLGHLGDLPPGGIGRANNYEPNQGWQSQLHIGPMAWSPDGRRIASASRFAVIRENWQPGGKIRVWDAATGVTLRVLDVNAANVWGLVLSPDGRSLAALSNSVRGGASGKVEVKVWDVTTGRDTFTILLDRQLPQPGTPTATPVVIPLAFSPDGRRLAAEDGKTVKVWDLATGAEGLALPPGSGAPMAWDADGRRLATRFGRPRDASWSFSLPSAPGVQTPAADADAVIKVWDAITGAELRTVKRGAQVQALLWGPDGQRLFIGGTDGITVWDPDSGAHFLTLKTPAERLWWAPGGGDLVSIGPKGPQVWETGGR